MRKNAISKFLQNKTRGFAKLQEKFFDSLRGITIFARSIAFAFGGFNIIYPKRIIIQMVTTVAMVARAAFGNDNSMIMIKVILIRDCT